MKNIEIILKNLPRSSREQIYLEAAAKALGLNGDNPDWEKWILPYCQSILVDRLKIIKGIGEESDIEILMTVGDSLHGN